jgi:hypothetical protein
MIVPKTPTTMTGLWKSKISDSIATKVISLIKNQNVKICATQLHYVAGIAEQGDEKNYSYMIIAQAYVHQVSPEFTIRRRHGP